MQTDAQNNTNEEQQDVVFIDAYNLIYRAFHGNQSKLTNAAGMPTNAIYTTANMLMKLKNQFTNLAYGVAVFDGGGNFRKELDENYKANRKPMPEDLVPQMPYIKTLFEILGWPIIQAENVEADDVIGSLAVRAASKGFKTYIVSSDKDFRQIVNENLSVLDTMNDIEYNREMVFTKMGVYPEHVREWLSLVGDTSDNVAGVDKIGPGNASKIIAEFGSLAGIIAHKDEVKGVRGDNLRAAIASGQLEKSFELVTLKTDLDIKITRKDVSVKNVDDAAWLAFCETMNFQTFIARIKKNSPKM